jgi:hypothetical protein
MMCAEPSLPRGHTGRSTTLNLENFPFCWALVALRPASIPPLFPVPSSPLGLSLDLPLVPSGPLGVSWIPRVPSGPFGVPLDPPACPPVPLKSLGSYSSIAIV